LLSKEIKILDLEDCIVTADALNTQKSIATAVIEANADQTTKEEAYFITSLEMDVSLFARGVRGHWGIEKWSTLVFGCYFQRGCEQISR